MRCKYGRSQRVIFTLEPVEAAQDRVEVRVRFTSKRRELVAQRLNATNDHSVDVRRATTSRWNLRSVCHNSSAITASILPRISCRGKLALVLQLLSWRKLLIRKFRFPSRALRVGRVVRQIQLVVLVAAAADHIEMKNVVVHQRHVSVELLTDPHIQFPVAEVITELHDHAERR